jgi:hypothetical protein
VKCGGLVEGEYDMERLKAPGAAMAVAALVAGFLGGFLGALSFLLAAGAVGSMLMAFTFDYRCQDCDRVASQRFMFEGERNDIRDRRASYFMRAGLMAVGAVVVGGFWIAAVLAGAGGKAADAPTATVKEARISPLDAMEKAGDVEGLARALRQPLMRDAAATALGKAGDNAVPFVLPALEDADEYTRRAALRVLTRIAPRTDRALDALVRVVQRDTVPGVRADAMRVLGAAGPAAKRAVPIIEPLLADYHLGFTAAAALDQIAPDTDWGARRKALTAK